MTRGQVRKGVGRMAWAVLHAAHHCSTRQPGTDSQLRRSYAHPPARPCRCRRRSLPWATPSASGASTASTLLTARPPLMPSESAPSSAYVVRSPFWAPLGSAVLGQGGTGVGRPQPLVRVGRALRGLDAPARPPKSYISDRRPFPILRLPSSFRPAPPCPPLPAHQVYPPLPGDLAQGPGAQRDRRRVPAVA